MVKGGERMGKGFSTLSGEKKLELPKPDGLLDILGYFARLGSAPVVLLGESGLLGLNEPGREIVKEIERDREL